MLPSFLVTDSMCMDPTDRKRYILDKVKEVYGNNGILADFGLSIDCDMVSWDAGRPSTDKFQRRDIKNYSYSLR